MNTYKPEPAYQLEEGAKAEKFEAHMNKPISRRELFEAVDGVVRDLAGSGWPEKDMIADAFRRLVDGLS